MTELKTAELERKGKPKPKTRADALLQELRDCAQSVERVLAPISGRAAGEPTTERARDWSKKFTELADIKDAELRAKEYELISIHEAAQERANLIVEFQAALDGRDLHAAQLQESSLQRAKEIEELTAALEGQNTNLKAREEVILELSSALTQREQDIEAVRGIAQERESLILELSAALGERDERVLALSATLEERNRLIVQLERIAEERLLALEQTDAGLRAITAEADRRAIILEELTSLLEERDRAG